MYSTPPRPFREESTGLANGILGLCRATLRMTKGCLAVFCGAFHSAFIPCPRNLSSPLHYTSFFPSRLAFKPFALPQQGFLQGISNVENAQWTLSIFLDSSRRNLYGSNHKFISTVFKYLEPRLRGIISFRIVFSDSFFFIVGFCRVRSK